MKRWARRLLKIAGYGFGLAVVAALVAVAFPEWFLQIEGPKSKADFLVVLGGEPRIRVQRAAELFHESLAPRILVSGYGDCAENIRQLVSAGVPRSAILRECESKSTLENARLSVVELRKAGAKKVILVTSWYHSRRAQACFRDAAPDLEFVSQPVLPGMRGYHAPASYIWNEYLKLGYYTVVHRIRPIGL